MPAPDEPTTSSRPYGPPDTEKKMMPMMAPSPSFRVTVRISIAAGASVALTAALRHRDDASNGSLAQLASLARHPIWRR